MCTDFESLESLALSCSLLNDGDGKKLRRLKNLRQSYTDDGACFTDITFTEGICHLSMDELSIDSCNRTTGLGISCTNMSHFGNRKFMKSSG